MKEIPKIYRVEWEEIGDEWEKYHDADRLFLITGIMIRLWDLETCRDMAGRYTTRVVARMSEKTRHELEGRVDAYFDLLLRERIEEKLRKIAKAVAEEARYVPLDSDEMLDFIIYYIIIHILADWMAPKLAMPPEMLMEKAQKVLEGCAEIVMHLYEEHPELRKKLIYDWYDKAEELRFIITRKEFWPE